MPDKCVSHSYTEAQEEMIRSILSVVYPDIRAAAEKDLRDLLADVNAAPRPPLNPPAKTESVGRAADAAPPGPLCGIEARIVDAAMRRLVEWREQNPEGLLPIEHHRAILGPGRALVEACLELEESRLGATTGPLTKEE